MKTHRDGVVLTRDFDRIDVSRGRVRVAIRIIFNELASRVRGARTGYWQNIELSVPIADVSSPELSGLCALNSTSSGANATAVDAASSLFDTSAVSFDAVISQCGIGEPTRDACAPPGSEACCPALPFGDALDLCAFTQCDELAFRFCLYDCCVSGFPDAGSRRAKERTRLSAAHGAALTAETPVGDNGAGPFGPSPCPLAVMVIPALALLALACAWRCCAPRRMAKVGTGGSAVYSASTRASAMPKREPNGTKARAPDPHSEDVGVLVASNDDSDGDGALKVRLAARSDKR
ncbi:hypothetical protein KFE25_012841 [Diacronema lutheri]|uniref:Uncharacterized protein n=2 Tax=Diacronema lutheri TaxID=2081491 RepID=A0A8J5X2W8_DIALT|nr:hypothetical protein KFE25_012841 [Diacronema lutheri]